MIELDFKQDGRQSFNDLLVIIFSFIFVLGLLGIIVLFVTAFKSCTSSNVSEDQWGGYYPGQIYTVFDKETGVYYVITDQGGISPMYTIEGEVKLVDQGNEYVVHKNLGEPDVQE